MAKKQTKTHRKTNRFLKFIVQFFIVAIVIFSGFIGSIYMGLWGELPTKEELKQLSSKEASVFYDRQGKTITKIYQINREIVSLDELPKHLINALIATEDVRFYDHEGVDTRSILRVLVKTILGGDRSSGGGSTITLQLAKNIYGREDYGWFSIPVNKIKEAFVARRMESIYSKDKILELYLNTVPFSGNTYGIESASKQFYSIPAAQLGLAEAATLVGTLKANHSYNPRLFPERSQLRRDVVITQMLKYHYINQTEADAVLQQALRLNYNTATSTGSEFLHQRLYTETQHILDSLNELNESKFSLKTSGLRIKTSIDYTLQQAFEHAITSHLKQIQARFEREYATKKPWKKKDNWWPVLKTTKRYKQLKKKSWSDEKIIAHLKQKQQIEVYNGQEFELQSASVIDSLQAQLKLLNAASLTIDPRTGEILSYVGGADFKTSQFDVIKLAKRQVGSTFKPFIYASGLKAGLTPCDYLSAQNVTYTDYNNWQPKNASQSKNDSHTNLSLTHALAQSINTVSVKVLEEAGISSTINLARDFQIKSDIPAKPSIALGAVNLSFEELARAYSGVVTPKIPLKFNLIKQIWQGDHLIYESEPSTFKDSPLESKQRLQLLAMLEEVVHSGTAKSLRNRFGIKDALAGKTGTTQDNKDGWFVGLTPHLVSINWVGHNQQRIGFKSTALGQGAVTALPLFAKAYQQVNQTSSIYKTKQFDGISQDIINNLDCEPTKRDGFLKRLFKKTETEKDFQEKGEQAKKEKKGFLGWFKKKSN